jgi:hypothetical protein
MLLTEYHLVDERHIYGNWVVEEGSIILLKESWNFYLLSQDFVVILEEYIISQFIYYNRDVNIAIPLNYWVP